jgi:hypothetical protein
MRLGGLRVLFAEWAACEMAVLARALCTICTKKADKSNDRRSRIARVDDHYLSDSARPICRLHKCGVEHPLLASADVRIETLESPKSGRD